MMRQLYSFTYDKIDGVIAIGAGIPQPCITNNALSLNVETTSGRRNIHRSLARALTAVLVILSNLAFIQNSFSQKVETITASGSWTVPVNVSSVKVEVWGGGGAGGGCNPTSSAWYFGKGGGGGAYKVSTFTVNPGEIYTVTVGAGGIGADDADGGAGGATTVTGQGGTVVANPGTGGGRRGGIPGTGGSGTFNGGGGGDEVISGAGGGGGAGNAGNGGTGGDANPVNGIGIGGIGDPNVVPYKGGDGGANKRSGNGNPGKTPGGGGGGGGTAPGSVIRSGGAGAGGQVILTYNQTASKLAFTRFPATGGVNQNFTTFTVEAQRPDNSVDNSYNGNITLTKASGPGNLSGTLTVAAVNGVATFSAVKVDLSGSYTLYANSGTLTQAVSNIIVITGAGDYRSKISGNWSNPGTWQTFNGTAWVNATSYPTSANGIISILNNNTVTADIALSVDELKINNGGTININPGIKLTITDGPGLDVINNAAINVNSGSGLYGNLEVNGQLQCSPGSYIAGTGDFNLQSGATIDIGSLWGITALGSVNGNVRTAHVRNFSTGANYVYTSAGYQATGSGLPATTITGNITVTTQDSLVTTNAIITSGILTVNGTLNPGAPGQTMSGTGTLTGSGIVKVSKTGSNADFSSQYTFPNKTTANLTVDYIGSAPQFIAANEFPGNSAFGITSSNSSGVTLNSDFSVNNLTIYSGKILTLVAGRTLTATTVENNAGIAGLIIKSDPSGDAKLINNTPSVPATVELNLSGGEAALGPIFHYFVPPVASMNFNNSSTATAAADLGLVNFDGDLMNYSESAAGSNQDNGWQYFDGFNSTTPFSTLTSSMGYNVFLPGNDKFTFKGQLNAEDHRFNNLSFTNQGWNLVGNPYPCNYDLRGIPELTSTSDGVDNTIYFNHDGGYAVWNVITGGTTGYSNILPPMQGFFVNVTAGGQSLNMPAAYKTTTTALPLRSKGAASAGSTAVKKIKLVLNNGKAPDETIVCLIDKATSGFDGDYDAHKLFIQGTQNPYIFTELNGVEYAINTLPVPTSETIKIPVTIVLKTQGTYKINITEFENLEGIKIRLRHGSAETVLTDNSSYTFTSEAGTFKDFELIIGGDDSRTGNNEPLNGELRTWYSNNILYINFPVEMSSGMGKLAIYDMQGKIVYRNDEIFVEPGQTIQLPLTLTGGLYISNYYTNTQSFKSKIVVF